MEEKQKVDFYDASPQAKRYAEWLTEYLMKIENQINALMESRERCWLANNEVGARDVDRQIGEKRRKREWVESRIMMFFSKQPKEAAHAHAP